ncbi:helix-turn-helix domain-containing protein [Virgisporangium aurantiacum]|uniref:XRE family transcriptional regulator n=1 Tax=Virgisporangium aurantiacum TaxID=175570 RepID=A0A8J3Z1K8_9ACTN|nr:helix-turn-helix transcriptional regulator [Virgisporangium aurantiacum]GIJ54842.1 XRE family transcriptional regulator [Virgisporangium aurantiacum]
MPALRAVDGGTIEVLPLVVVVREFPARPSSMPDIRDFVRRRLSQTPFSEDDLRTLGEEVLKLLLEVAGPTGAIQVSLRIFPDYAEIDVVPAIRVDPPGGGGAVGAPAPVNGNGGPGPNGRAGPSVTPAADRSDAASFADWFAGALRREGMTMEAAARHLQVSVKTVSRWVGGTTEPRLRDLSRIREILGDLPFP